MSYRDWICRFFASSNEMDYAIKPIVYCKECRYNVSNMQKDRFDATDYSGDDIVCSYFMTDGMEANDFCSRGKFSPQTIEKDIE